MLKDKGLQKEIIVSVIAAILVTVFFDPVIELIWEAILWASNLTYKGFINAIYRNAAMGHRNYIEVMIFIFSATATLGLFFTRMFPTRSCTVLPKLRARLSVRGQRIVGALLFVILALSVIILLLLAFSDLQLNTSFEQRLAVLAPGISEQEYKELKALWASMDSRDDFEAITNRMEDWARQHGINLPNLLLR